MKKLILILLVAAIAFSACTNKRDSDFKAITSLEEEITKDPTAPIDLEKGKKMAEAYFDFAKNYPNDSLAPIYLLKSAEVYTSIDLSQKAIESLDKILSKYPDHDILPQSIHFLAFIYDDKVKDYDQAAKYYNMLIQKFPQHELAENAKGCLMILGKSDEELLQQLQKADSLVK